MLDFSLHTASYVSPGPSTLCNDHIISMLKRSAGIIEVLVTFHNG